MMVNAQDWGGTRLLRLVGGSKGLRTQGKRTQGLGTVEGSTGSRKKGVLSPTKFKADVVGSWGKKENCLRQGKGRA